MKVVIGARKSALSRIQAYEVGKALQAKHPELAIEYRFRESLGDVQSTQRLTSFGDRGVFTEDFTRSLMEGEIDLAVHSWKDLPTAERAETVVTATLPRADAHDVLLLVRNRVTNQSGPIKLSIHSCSPRREYNLKEFLTWATPCQVESVAFELIRGNIETRIRKLLEGSSHGLVVAKAALDRLLSAKGPEFSESREFIARAIEQCFVIVVPLAICPAAPAQGAIAAEILRSREDLQQLLSTINDQDTFGAVTKERAVLAAYGGGCHQKIGVTVLRRPYGEVTFLRGLTDGGVVLQSSRITAKDVVLPRAEKGEAIWPPADAPEFFERQELPAQIPSHLASHGLWIAKADALPSSLSIAPGRPVWVAGLVSWRKMAARGVWVTGCAEGLGESEDPMLDEIFPQLKGWVKLTHADGVEASEGETVPTYKLVPRSENVDLGGYTHFFWKSGSACRAAIEKNPEIKNRFHGCGPGHTYEVVKTLVGAPERVGAFLSFEEFLEEVRP